MELEYEVKNLDLIDKALRNLDKKTRSKISTKALKVGGKLIVNAAKANVHTQSGTLKKSIGMTVRKSRNKMEKNIAVLSRKGKSQKFDGFYSHMEEFGTSHSPAHPFLGPAAKDKAGEVIKTVGVKLAGFLVEVTK